jgi:hypothetical protein
MGSDWATAALAPATPSTAAATAISNRDLVLDIFVFL